MPRKTVSEHKNIERNIALLNLALDNVHEAAFLTNEDARFLYVNEESCRLLGYTRDELLRLGVADIDPDFPMERWPDHWEELRTRVPMTFEGRHRAKDGHILPVEINDNYFEYEGQGYNLALVRDITERTRAEEEHLAHLRFLVSMDKVNRAIQGANELKQMMSDVLDAVLSIFECDRAYLMYPCEPEAESWVIPMERTTPDYPGSKALGVDLSKDERVAGKLRLLLSSDGPVNMGYETPYILSGTTAEQFSIRSMMAMAVYPKVGKPWEFGIHHCSCDRLWTPEEERLLKEIGRRLEDALTSLLTHRDLQESEERYRRIVDTATEGIWVVGPDTMTSFVNARMAEMLGYPGAEMIGWPFTDFMFEEDVPDHLQKLENRRKGISETYERRFHRKDGQTVWTHASTTPIFDAEHHFNGSFGMFTDITERKRVEDTLRFIAQRSWAGTADTFLIALAGYLGVTLGMDYVLIAQLADDDHTMVETVALYAKGEILPNMRYELKGTPCDNIIGRNLCLYPERVQALFPADTLLMDMGAESYAGIPLWDLAGRQIGLLAVLDGRPFHDEAMISYILQLAAASAAAALERERHDRLLMAREREFRTLAENSPDCILRYDNGCRCIYANPRIENTLGIPAGGMPGRTPMEVFPSGEYREYQDRIEEVLRTGADADLEVVVPDTGEGVRYHHVRFTAERDQKGAITGVLVIGRDITERKRMENVLRESEERFRTLTEKSFVGVYIIQDDLFRYVNPAFAKIFGYKSEKIVDILGPIDFITTEDRERVLDSIGHRIAGEIEFSHHEFHISRKDGSIRVVETFGSRASHHGRPAIIGTIIDITERKIAEDNLFQVTERWERTFDAVPDLIAIIDTDFRIVQANKAMADRLGATPAECAGQLCYAAVHNSEAPPSFCPHAQTLTDCHEHMCEVREECLGGDFIVSTTPIYNSAGLLMGSVHVARDITERKYAETKLNEQLHFLQQLLDSIPIPVYYKDVGGVYLGCNAAFEKFIGLSRRDVVGKTVYEVAPKERADKHHEADSALLRHPGVQIYEASGIYNNGECHNVIFNKATFVDANNCVSGIVGAMIDITSLRKAEEERKMLEAQLHQAQKMEAIGQLAGGIAHDFNNILTAIMGYTAMVLLKMEKRNPFRRHLEQILASSERAAELTHGLLAFSRKQVLHAKPIDLCRVVRSLKKMLGRLFPEDIDFRTTVAEGDLIVMADKGQIEQVLMNLVTNAKDAMPMGGTLKIEVSPVVVEERFVHADGFGEPGHYACVTVADTGQGMDKETRKRIFEPFFTTKEVGKGTGLGMSIIYGIIQQHKGYITIYSEKGIGTTFKIYLPLIVDGIKEMRDTREEEPPPGGTETVLLAEDDAAVLELHRMILEEAGYRVIEAVDGQDALDKFTEYRTEVDILATDVIMPKINGKSLYEEIRKIRPDIKVLFMSGYTKDIIMERGIMEDEFSVITKPVTPHELLKKMREILDWNRLQ
jgi:PAS domain S-box-containing protein